MQASKFEIKPYDNKYRQQLLTVWEESVLATHDFLTAADFSEIKAIVQAIDFTAFPVYCMVEKDVVAGFIGVADQKVEMLFVHPTYFGLRLGQMLINFARTELMADKVDVNEQNVKAVKFYEKLGFEIFERTEKDDQGRDYPLLRMRLKEQ